LFSCNYLHSRELFSFNYLSSMDYEKCLEECKEIHKKEPNFCKRVCEPDVYWTFLCFDEKGSAYFYHVEEVVQSYIFPKEKIVTMWVKKIFSNKDKLKYIKLGPKYKKIDYEITLYKIDCAEKKYKLLKTVIYASDGSVIKEVSAPKWETEWMLKWDYIVPGSMERKLLIKVCM